MIVASGSGSIFLTVALQQFLSFSVNSMLGNVRNLQYVTHMMMMQLIFPASVGLFFSSLFEFVTYDVLPTDDIYVPIFGWNNEPYSDEAELIGYESRYTIENTGSLLIYLICIGLRTLLFYTILKRCDPKFKRTRSWAKRKQNDFLFSGAIDFYNENYLCIVFSLGINSSSFKLNSLAEFVNNLFAISLSVAFFAIQLLHIFMLR